jgi:hypothetical protein
MGIYNSSFNNILFISYWSILLLGFAQKPSTCCKSLTNIITPPVGCYQFHNFSVDMYWLQRLIKIQQHGHSGDGHWFDGKMQIQLTFDHSQFYFLLSFWEIKGISYNLWTSLLSLPNNVWRLIVFAPFLIIIKSPKQLLETYCFCSVSYYYYYSLSFFPWTMNLSTADLRNYWTEFHETWWSYRYMFLVGPKVFSLVVKGVKVIFWGVQRGWGLL